MHSRPCTVPKTPKFWGNLKYECNGTAPLEFVGLRSKMYSLLVSRQQAKMTAKGIKKTFVKKHLKHHMFLKTLQNNSFTTAEYLSFRSRNHSIHTRRNFETCLSSYDDKRYVLADGINSLAYGHHLVKCDAHGRVDT